MLRSGLLTAIAVLELGGAVTIAQTPQSATAEPWTAHDTVQPAVLAQQLSQPNSAQKSIVVCVGFHSLYQHAHIPGSSFHGPASTPDGLTDLKRWARPIPRSARIIVYCGCCPLAHCPNTRPAFAALRAMGFTNVRLLDLPADFAHDWFQAGFPVAKGK